MLLSERIGRMAELHIDHKKVNGQNGTETDRMIYDYLEAGIKDYYDEEIADEPHFQVWYQLSSLRTGLLSWYPFREHAEVLEIGAGFGALTGLLCDRCAHVTATERSAYRASALAKRWNVKNNLDVYAGEWSEIRFDKKFDYIVLTGILERVCKGSWIRRDYADYLKKVSGLLKEDGLLLMAVDNRLGLKYFCGARESHGGKAFEGIDNYPQGTRGYSFSREELKDILTKAGLGKLRFYYPLPDYKLPQMVYSDEHLPEPGLRERLITYDLNHSSLVAVERELYRDVLENGVFPFFANSFFVECGKDRVQEEPGITLCGLYGQAVETAMKKTGREPEAGIPEPAAGAGSQVVYAAVSTDRGRKRGYATTIRTDGTVRKTPLFPEGKENARNLYDNIEDLRQHGIPVVDHQLLPDGSLEMPYISWPTLSNYIKEVIKEDQEAFLSLIDRIYEYILKSSDQAPDSENALLSVRPDCSSQQDCSSQKDGKEGNCSLGAGGFGPVLRKAYMELIPLNCFYHPDTKEFLYFDQEFVRENYPAKYVLFRAIHYIYCFTPNAELYYPKQKLIEKYGMKDTWQLYWQEEQRFLDEVRNHRKYQQFYRWAAIDRKRIQANVKRLESEEETIADYKISDKMKKTWKVELDMLDEVNRICRKYHLTWFLVHGSLLGAVRHKGFIPWDDDLDIAMPRKDYNRFLRVARKELKEPLSIHTPETEKDIFWGGFARVRNSRTTGIEARELSHKGNLGIWIDILPLDVCTMDEKLFEKKEKRIRHCHRLLLAKIYGNDFERYMDMGPLLWNGYRLLSRLYPHKVLCRMLNRAMLLYTDMQSEDVAMFTGYYKHRRLSAGDFKKPVLLEFEQRKYPVPEGYENYLFMSMGKDFMKYPPKEQRKPKHTGIFDPEKPYEDYQKMLTGIFENVKGRKIILFGAGMMMEDYMKKWGNRYRPDFLVDNDENKWDRQRFGIPIKSPEEILKIPEGKRRLIICSFYYKEIQKQLEQMGIHDYCVYVQHVEWIVKSEES